MHLFPSTERAAASLAHEPVPVFSLPTAKEPRLGQHHSRYLAAQLTSESPSPLSDKSHRQAGLDCSLGKPLARRSRDAITPSQKPLPKPTPGKVPSGSCDRLSCCCSQLTRHILSILHSDPQGSLAGQQKLLGHQGR